MESTVSRYVVIIVEDNDRTAIFPRGMGSGSAHQSFGDLLKEVFGKDWDAENVFRGEKG